MTRRRRRHPLLPALLALDLVLGCSDTTDRATGAGVPPAPFDASADASGPEEDSSRPTLDGFRTADARSWPPGPVPRPDLGTCDSGGSDSGILPDPLPPGTTSVATGVGIVPLLDVFPFEAGLIVVFETGLVSYARDGTELARWDAADLVTTAAFDGTTLAVAGLTTLTVLDVDLRVSASGPVAELCFGSAIVSGARVVLSPSDPGSPRPMNTIYTFELATATEIARTEIHQPAPQQLRQLPGTDRIVASSPLSLYSIDEAGAVTWINYAADESLTAATFDLAFYGDPVTHVIGSGGNLLRIEPCEPGSRSTCFERDGTLGLEPCWLLLRLSDDRGGDLYSIAGSGRYRRQPCAASGCLLQHWDVDRRRVVSEMAFWLYIGHFTAFRYDPWSRRVALAYRGLCSRESDACDDDQWAVLLVPFE